MKGKGVDRIGAINRHVGRAYIEGDRRRCNMWGGRLHEVGVHDVLDVEVIVGRIGRRTTMVNSVYPETICW